MLFRSVFNNKRTYANFNINIKGKILKRTRSAKILGITIDEKLNFKEHINQLTSKLAKGMYILIKLAKFIPLNILKTVFDTNIYPHLIYCLPIYGVTSNSTIKPIITMQKKFVRLLSGSRNFYSHTPPLFKRLKMLNLNDLTNLSILKIIHQTLSNKTSNFLKQKIQPVQTRRNINLRNNSHIIEPFHRLSKTQQSTVYKGTRLYNQLSERIKNQESINSYTKLLKEMYLNRY